MLRLPLWKELRHLHSIFLSSPAADRPLPQLLQRVTLTTANDRFVALPENRTKQKIYYDPSALEAIAKMFLMAKR